MVAREGVEPSASLVLSQSGLPIAYLAVVEKGGFEPPTLALQKLCSSTELHPQNFKAVSPAVKSRGFPSYR